MQFNALTQVALLGTERQGLPSVPADSPFGEVLARVDGTQRELALLRVAALTGQYERAGALPVKVGTTDVVKCPPETLPWVKALAGSHLLTMLAGEKTELLTEWLRLCAATKQLAPPEAGPLLLSLGQAKEALREMILPVLGERGRWLAGQQLEWSWVTGETLEESVWQTGEPEARLMFLQKLRVSDPAKARELLESTWKEEEPEERAAFMQVLGKNLSLADEAFLEAAFDDKRKEVRRKAADLLAQIPNSALVKRMQERLQPLLKFKPAEEGSILKLKKGTKASLEINLPTECSKAMQRDGIEAKPPAKEIGERAWWLAQMLGCVPPAYWREQWGCTSADYYAAAMGTEFKKALHLGLQEAAVRYKDIELAESFFAEDAGRVTQNLWSVMPIERRERYLSQWLESPTGFGTELLFESLHDWSPGFSRAVLKWMRNLCAQDGMEWQLRNRFKELVGHLAPEVLSETTQGWPTGAKNWEFWSKGVDEFLAMAQFRLEMRRAILGQD
jgi:hypothetical protein